VFSGLQLLKGWGFFVYVNEAHSDSATIREFISQTCTSSASAPVKSDLTAVRLRFVGATGTLFGTTTRTHRSVVTTGPSSSKPRVSAPARSRFSQAPPPSANVFGDNALGASEPSTYLLMFVGLVLLVVGFVFEGRRA
jgi:hypothetical protein